MGCNSCIINPSKTNYKAIKAYEKVGFSHICTLDRYEGYSEYVMKIDRQQLV